MTADEITKLAAEVMTSGIKQDGARYVLPESMVIEMVRRIEAAEREACAFICDGISDYYETRTDLNQTQKQVGRLAAEVCGVRIRERQ